jgi:hypothetical protein
MPPEDKNTVTYGRGGSSGGAVTPAFAREGLSISQLRAALRGRVIAPDDPEYDQARAVFLGEIDRRPAVIARVADETDVSRVVSLARENGLELAVRSGGHSGAGHSASGGGLCSTSRTCGRWTSTSSSAPPGPRQA